LQAVYYRDAAGREPVNEFIDGLPVEAQVAIDNQIGWLNMQSASDPPLPFPHSSQVRGALRELRCHYGSELYRVLYRRSERFFILLHMFRKNTGAIPEAEIQVAQARWEDFKTRMNAARRAPPRAVGHDAP